LVQIQQGRNQWVDAKMEDQREVMIKRGKEKGAKRRTQTNLSQKKKINEPPTGPSDTGT